MLNSKEIKSQYFINHRFKKVLKGYRKICLLTSEKLTQPKDILTRFNEIITDQWIFLFNIEEIILPHLSYEIFYTESELIYPWVRPELYTGD